VAAKDQLRGMEGILRQAMLSNPAMEIVVLHFADPDKLTDYSNNKIPEEIAHHEKAAIHYKANSINLAMEVTERIAFKEFSWEKDFVDLHPSPFGQQLYFTTIKELFEQAAKTTAPVTRVKQYTIPPIPLDQFSYYNGNYINIEKATRLKGWKIDPDWNSNDKLEKREDFVHVPMLINEDTTGSFSFNFTGKAVGIFVLAGPEAGIINYSIDGGTFKKIDPFTEWSHLLYLPWLLMLETELKTGKHTLTVRSSNEKNSKSAGSSIRIRRFVVN
jgi:sialidase-1